MFFDDYLGSHGQNLPGPIYSCIVLIIYRPAGLDTPFETHKKVGRTETCFYMATSLL